MKKKKLLYIEFAFIALHGRTIRTWASIYFNVYVLKERIKINRAESPWNNVVSRNT